MGKLDDMRQLREQQYANAQKKKSAVRPADPVPPAPPAKAEGATESDETVKPVTAKKAPIEPAEAKAKAKAPDAAEGKCPGCGKMKPLKNGVFAQHMKGFGKACPGSRKEPA